jgi:hypothetical protein
MSFSPVIPFGGYTGWKFLTRTREAQQDAFERSGSVQRNEQYFRENIGRIDSAKDLVADFQLLTVALESFGLSDDISNKYFVQKVLEEGTLDPEAFANKLADKRYVAFSKEFGFGDYAVPRTKLSDFADRILNRYEDQAFEEAVGAQNDQLRLAMNAERELGTIAGKSISGDAKWLTILGSAPLREVFQTAFGLPQAFAGVDLDKQIEVLKDRAERFLGFSDISGFGEEDATEHLIRLYLLRSDNGGFGATYSAAASALTLLQNGTAQIRA